MLVSPGVGGHRDREGHSRLLGRSATPKTRDPRHTPGAQWDEMDLGVLRGRTAGVVPGRCHQEASLLATHRVDGVRVHCGPRGRGEFVRGEKPLAFPNRGHGFLCPSPPSLPPSLLPSLLPSVLLSFPSFLPSLSPSFLPTFLVFLRGRKIF
jgi:hypothetical protein